MRKNIFTILFLIIPLYSLAENQFVFVGKVIDSFTGISLKNVHVTVMNKDSVELTTCITTDNANQNCEIFNIKEKQGTYILKYELKDYETTFYSKIIKNARTNFFKLDDVKMKRLPKMLGDAKVRATKIKMIIRKDTIVYNADAFQLAEGSMLDDLIRLLPGVTLKNNGQILVNGKFVNSLLVNGNDFFHGDPSIALKNLPSYIVDKIKIYDKNQANAYLTQPDSSEKKPLVMDVLLKKQYSIGWIANAEFGGGTNNKYLTRLFGMRFTDHSRLAFYSNFNNINDTQQHSTDGDWNPAWVATGQTSLKTGGAELLINDKHGIYKQISNARFDYQNIKDNSESSGELFLKNGNTYSRNKSLNRNYPEHFITNHDFSLSMKKMYIQLQPFLEYTHYKNKSQYYAATLSNEIYEAYRGALIDSLFGNSMGYFQQFIVNQNSILSKGYGHQWQTGINYNMTFRVPREGDWIKLNGFTKYTYSSYKSFLQNDLKYASQIPSNDYRNQYTNVPNKNYNLMFHGIYTYKITQQFSLQPQYEFERIYKSTDRDVYRLDQYSEWNSINRKALGILPSTNDSLLHCIDQHNSYNSNYYSTIHTPELQFGSIQSKLFSLNARLRWRIENDKLRYHKNQNDTTIVRRYNSFVPYIWGNIWNIHYEYRHDVINADLMSMVNTSNDENPLFVSIGNPNLKNITSENVTLNYSQWKQKKQQHLSITPSYILWTNNVAERITYDRSTGIRTYQPQNINGNWTTSCQIDYGQTFDKNNFWMFETKSNISYYNNVDLIVESNKNESSRSTVHNVSCQEDISVKYQKANFEIEFLGKVLWTNATSKRTNFSTINCADFNYGINTVITMPLKIQLSTNLTMYSRRGYNDNSMNTNNLVWNARVSRSVLKGRLIGLLDAFDILGNLSNVRRTLNAQGRTETWYNVVPHYVMFHLIYRLNVQPKKKQLN